MDKGTTLLEPEARVLPTLEADGSRRWLFPRLAKGRVWKARLVVAWGLILLFAVMPFVKMGGQPVVLFDLAGRKLHLFGQTFLPRDTVLLALLLVSFILTIFLTTAMLGRAWCGWTCPQTVYMEFVYRPVERLFMGRSGVGGKPKSVAAWRYVGMYASYLLISLYVAHVCLAYLVGVDVLKVWVTRSPLEHPSSFAIIAVATAAMMFNFSFFREQMCLIACPYGRFQSVLLDRNSLIVKYDAKRGEPRKKGSGVRGQGSVNTNTGGEGGALHLPVLTPDPSSLTAAPRSSDCVDCSMCVQVCPTGIDIRDGLQFECVNCAQCIDACNTVMKKVGRPEGLIRYSSQNEAEGKGQRFLRPRVVIYAGAICVFMGSLVAMVATKSTVDVLVVRNQGLPFVMSVDGRAENTVRVQMTNRLEVAQRCVVSVVDDPAVVIAEPVTSVEIEGGKTVQLPIHLLAQVGVFRGTGTHRVTVRVASADGKAIDTAVQMFGPAAGEETK